jgi:Protein of unknown function (DUF1761)
VATFNLLPIVVAAVIVFVVSTAWYIVFASARGALSPTVNAAQASARPPIWKIATELIRSVVVAALLAWLVRRLGITDWRSGALLGLALWLGFPAVLLSGSVLWDNVPWKVAAIHAGDWLLKLIVIALIVTLWR